MAREQQKFFALLLVSFALIPHVKLSDPYSFEHDGKAYTVHLDEVTWKEAYDLCKAELSVLAKVPDQETQDAIAGYLGSDEAFSSGSFWIDLRDTDEEGVWKDSEGDEQTFTAWTAGEPNNGGYETNRENCAHLSWEHNFLWNDLKCKSRIYFICQSDSTPNKCYNEPEGNDYVGTVSTTVTGIECQYWSEQYPQSHGNFKPYPSLSGHNYCRNPEGSGDRTWCYTTDPDTRWEYCDVGSSRFPCDPDDDPECYSRYDGADYAGRVNVTANGKTCQNWNEQTPHRHSYRGDDYLVGHNYCRNPSFSRNGPWCYTTNPDIRWQYCDVCGEGIPTDNIALNKPASQSSLFQDNAVAGNAVDGFKSTYFGDESCTHTDLESEPWWKVDLEDTYFVTEVIITNRRDCCAERLEGAVVRVGSKRDGSMNGQCGEPVSAYDAAEKHILYFQCDSDAVGRYVSVHLEAKYQHLTLCEVEVRGTKADLWRHDGRCGPRYEVVSNLDGECNPNSVLTCCSGYGWCGASADHCECRDCIDYTKVDNVDETSEEDEEKVNLALNKATSQSSLHSDRGVADHAVDGFKSSQWIDGSCSHTLLDFEPWWKVDLGDTYPIGQVVITNRRECCSERLEGAVIRTGTEESIRENAVCGGAVSIDQVTEKSITIDCGGRFGRFVSVQIEGREEYLTLCEVEVYEADVNWRADAQCGPGFTAPNGVSPAECDPHGIYPCCSTANWCGISADHCECYGCIDYREVYGVSQSPVSACSQPTRITIVGDEEVTVTSPDYPNIYPSYADCRWFITADSNSDIQVTINYVDLENCCADVYIGTGDTIGNNDLFTITNDMSRSTVAESNEVWIQFDSSASEVRQGKGFSIALRGQPKVSTANSWRDDVQCGTWFEAPNGVHPAECDPHGIYPCCSTANWCGISDDHCKCYGCIDYREVYGVTESPVDACSEPKRITIVGDEEVTVTSPDYPNIYPSYADCRWFITADANSDIQVTINYVDLENCCADVYIGTGDTIGNNDLFTITNDMSRSTVAESNEVWIQFDSSASEVKQGTGFSITLRGQPKPKANSWRDDVQCGTWFEAPNGVHPAECDPHGIYPCCSTANWCGISDDHCKCYGCIDYREVYGVTESPVDACSEPKRITIVGDEEVTVTSPDYPNFYPSYADCRWFITADSNSDIQVTVNDVDLENCCADVYIGTGDTIRNNELFTITNDMSRSTVAESNEVWIQFDSSATGVERGTGFSITLKGQPKGPSWREDLQCGGGWTVPNGVSPAECDPYGIYPCCSTTNRCGISDDHCKCDGCIDYRETYNVGDESPVAACSEVKHLQIPKGGEVNITTPGYPGVYPNSANCRWMVSTEDPNDYIEIQVDRVTMEPRDTTYVGIGPRFGYDGVLRVEGNVGPIRHTVRLSKVWVQFQSDNNYAYQGFLMTLRSKIPDPEPREIGTGSACWSVENVQLSDRDIFRISSPGYPSEYPDDATCKWLLSTTSPNIRMKVEFLAFSTEEDGDILEIGSGDTFDENRIISASGRDYSGYVPPPITDTYTNLWMKFESDWVLSGTGFQVEVTTVVEYPEDPVCTSRWSNKSGPGDDAQAEVECEDDEKMTSCNSATSDRESHGTRDGERIDYVTLKPKCVAQNGAGGLGVYAVARCCKWRGLQCYYTDSTQKSGTEDDDTAEAMCEGNINGLPVKTVGCMAHTLGQWLDGARPWSNSDDFTPNLQSPFSANGCVAQNGIYGDGVWAGAACCSAPGLRCQHVYSERSPGVSNGVAFVRCDEGWIMTGCSVFTYWGVTDGAYITADGTCKAINGGQASMGNNTRGVWAVAICCKGSED